MVITRKKGLQICREDQELLKQLHDNQHLIRDIRLVHGGPYRLQLECRQVAQMVQAQRESVGDDVWRAVLTKLAYLDMWFGELALILRLDSRESHKLQNELAIFYPRDEIFAGSQFFPASGGVHCEKNDVLPHIVNDNESSSGEGVS